MSLRTRDSIRVLFREYAEERQKGGKSMTRMEKLIRAWVGIQSDKKLQQDPWNSFFMIGGLHGAPFRGAGWANSQWWGGFCNHGNILFPTWHRAYLLRIENALRSVPGCEDVALAFWDETEADSINGGVPEVFGMKNFLYLTTGETVPNPLYSYTFQRPVYDNIPGGDPWDYTKKIGYATKRFPLSGLEGQTPELQAKINQHNKDYEPYAWPYLNMNVRTWLANDTINQTATALLLKYQKCLTAPNYTVFSNTTSAAQYNEEHFQEKGLDPKNPGDRAVVALEDPHNGMHLAVGGFEGPGGNPSFNFIPLANGDMGENDTAGLDPIFFFHHCWIDLVFWEWQRRHGEVERLRIDQEYTKYPGTNSVDSQGPTPGVSGNVWLDLDSPLSPFTTNDQPEGAPMTSNDVVNIHNLGYKYGPSSISSFDLDPLVDPVQGLSILRVSGINRAAHRGSFVIKVTAKVDGKEKIIAHEPVLSRNHVAGCANCQTHLNVRAFVPIHPDDVGQNPDLCVYVSSHENKEGERVDVSQKVGTLAH